MTTPEHHSSRRAFTRGVAAFAVTSLALLSSCATRYSTEPTPTQTTANSVTLDEFYTPGPSGEADDYYLINEGEDDVEYSYFIDEDDYVKARDIEDDHSGDRTVYYFIHDKVKNGHGYGDHNHIHVHIKGPHHYHGRYIGVRRVDWTDSLALRDSEKVQIDSAMRAFRACAKSTVDSFKVAMKPYREEFRTRRMGIIASLDSGKINRDSARVLLDSAIVTYETETQLLRAGFVADLKECRAELDVAIKAILTPVQYEIWVRHRGW